MKKKIVVIVFLSLAIACFSTTIAATEQYDSVNLSFEEREEIQNNASDTLIKIYSGLFFGAFSERMSVYEVTNSDSVYQYKYMIIGEQGQISYKYRQKDGVIRSFSSEEYDWSNFFQYVLNPRLVFDWHYRISEIYCFDGLRDGSFIYYKTDKGDFVLYRESLEDEKMALLSIDEFYDFAESVYIYTLQNADNYIGYVIPSDCFDLSAYIVYPKTMNIDRTVVAVSIVAVLLSVAIVFFVLHNRIKKSRRSRVVNVVLSSQD